MVTVTEIQLAGVTIKPHEAVAIAQLLIDALGACDATSIVEPPYGPPSAANVLLKRDGTVTCRECGTTPASLEVAILLQAMLPSASPSVPGGLRYTIARALLEVDVPPFDTLEDFSRSLARFERGPRDEAVRAVLQRFDVVRPAAALASIDRRRLHPPATDLRRALREADAQLYLQKSAVERMRAPAPAPAPPAPPARSRSAPAVVACAAGGLLLIATGEFTQLWHQASPVPAARVSRDITLVPDPDPAPRGEKPSVASPATRVPAVAASRRDVARPSVKLPARSVRTEPVAARAPRPSSPKVLDRLKLRWLRNVFVSGATSL
jgi:hypothetical protein